MEDENIPTYKSNDLQSALTDYISVLRWLYIDGMQVPGQTLKNFKKIILEITSDALDRVDDKYCDHVESIRRKNEDDGKNLDGMFNE